MAVGVLLLALFVAWVGVVRVKTSKGIIELVNLPNDAEVFVDGAEVAVTWPGGGKPAVISVTAGKHRVSVKKDGLELSGDEVTVRAQGKEELIVRIVPPAAPPEIGGLRADPARESVGEPPLPPAVIEADNKVRAGVSEPTKGERAVPSPADRDRTKSPGLIPDRTLTRGGDSCGITLQRLQPERMGIRQE